MMPCGSTGVLIVGAAVGVLGLFCNSDMRFLWMVVVYVGSPVFEAADLRAKGILQPVEVLIFHLHLASRMRYAAGMSALEYLESRFCA